MSEYKLEHWYGWNGGECPFHGRTILKVSTSKGWFLGRADSWDWDNKETPINAFQVVKEYREPREFWIVAATGDAWETEARAKIAAEALVDPTIIHVREVLE